MSLVEYETVNQARAEFKRVLDVAERGGPVTVVRNGRRIALVDGERLRRFLTTLTSRAEVVADGDGWELFFPGLPVSAEGDTLDVLCDDAVVALREYAEDWVDHLHLAPNHADNWGLVQLVSLSTDDQLREWVSGFAP